MTENQMMSKEAAMGPDCQNWYVLTPFGHVAADSESNAIRVIQAAGLVIASAWTVGEITKGCWAKVCVAREGYFTDYLTGSREGIRKFSENLRNPYCER